MGRVAVIGERSETEWFALAGAQVIPAENADEARRSWGEVADDIVVVLLTPMAAEAIGTDVREVDERLVLTLPPREKSHG